MPLIDMPLEQLKTYQGRNPRPADFDAFWDRSVAEMEALGTDCELHQAAFQAPGAVCCDLYFTGMNGARIHANFARPAGQGPFPGLCLFHGYCGKADHFVTLMSYVQAGFAVAAMDARGQAGQSEDVGGVKGNTQCGQIIRGLGDTGPEKLLFRDIFLDAAQLARILMAMPEVDETRIGAFGGSQGGTLSLVCAALVPQLRRVAAFYPGFSDYKRIWEMDLAENAYREIRDHFRGFDPLHEHEEDIWTRMGYIDIQHLTPRIRAQVRMYTGLMDKIVPPSTQFAAYNHITAEKDVLIFPDYGHELPAEALLNAYQFLLGI